MFHSKKQAAAPTTSLLGAMYGRNMAAPPKQQCGSQPLQVPRDLFASESPMEDEAFYEHATWRMYHRIQAARQEQPHRTPACQPLLPSQLQQRPQASSTGTDW